MEIVTVKQTKKGKIEIKLNDLEQKTLAGLKDAIKKKEGASESVAISLYFKGSALDGDKSLEECGITDETSLIAIFKTPRVSPTPSQPKADSNNASASNIPVTRSPATAVSYWWKFYA